MRDSTKSDNRRRFLGSTAWEWLRTALVAVPITLFGLVILYFAVRAIAVAQQGYTWSEMDWNSDGNTSIVEFFESSDVGKREVVVNGRHCFDYFAYKDGLTIRLDCK